MSAYKSSSRNVKSNISGAKAPKVGSARRMRSVDEGSDDDENWSSSSAVGGEGGGEGGVGEVRGVEGWVGGNDDDGADEGSSFASIDEEVCAKIMTDVGCRFFLSPEQLLKIKELFDELDKKEKGYIDETDFRSPNKKHQQTLMALWESLRGIMDEPPYGDGSGTIDIKEFVSYFIINALKQQMSEEKVQSLSSCATDSKTKNPAAFLYHLRMSFRENVDQQIRNYEQVKMQIESGELCL